jgi:hypothetical protein
MGRRPRDRCEGPESGSSAEFRGAGSRVQGDRSLARAHARACVAITPKGPVQGRRHAIVTPMGGHGSPVGVEGGEAAVVGPVYQAISQELAGSQGPFQSPALPTELPGRARSPSIVAGPGADGQGELRRPAAPIRTNSAKVGERGRPRCLIGAGKPPVGRPEGTRLARIGGAAYWSGPHP